MSQAFIREIMDASHERSGEKSGPGFFSDGKPFRTISGSSISLIAGRYGKSPVEVEIPALENGIVPEKYIRNFNSISAGEQVRLLRSRVCIAGLGGLGGMVVSILARMGVGGFHLIDGDSFEESNLNRQWLCTEDNLGSEKAPTAARHVARINSSATVKFRGVFLTEENAGICFGDAQVVVDCLDTISDRIILEKAAEKGNLPLVSAAIAGESGQVCVVFPGERHLSSIYGDQRDMGAEAALGCLPHTAAMIAAIQCGEVVNILLGKKCGLRNRIFLADSASLSFEIMDLN